MMRAPDLERVTPDGFVIAVRFTPNLRAPVGARLTITRGALELDSVDVSAAGALEAYRHPCSVSPMYRRELAPEGSRDE